MSQTYGSEQAFHNIILIKRYVNTINLISSENRRSLRVVERLLQSSVEMFSNLD